MKGSRLTIRAFARGADARSGLRQHGARGVDTHFVFSIMNANLIDPVNYFFAAIDYLLETCMATGIKDIALEDVHRVDTECGFGWETAISVAPERMKRIYIQR